MNEHSIHWSWCFALLTAGVLGGACVPHVDDTATKNSTDVEASQARKVTRELKPRLVAELDGDSIEVTLVRDTECQFVATVGGKQVSSGWKKCSTEALRGVPVQLLVGGTTDNQTTDESGTARFTISLEGARVDPKHAVIKAVVEQPTPERFVEVPVSQSLSIAASPAYAEWVRRRDAGDSAQRTDQLAAAYRRDLERLDNVERDLQQINGNWDDVQLVRFATIVANLTSISGKGFSPAEQERLKAVSNRAASFAPSYKDEIRKTNAMHAATASVESPQQDLAAFAQAANQGADAFRERCQGGDRSACVMMQLMRGCAVGRSDACDSVGNAYVRGMGVGKDLDRAKAFWFQACRIYARRCVGYAVIILNSPGFSDGEKTARDFFEFGCAGDAEQCTVVGSLFRHGRPGLPRDDEKARAFFDRACKAGAASGCLSLSNFDRL